MMLLKCCTQYVSKFGKPSSGHRTGKHQFSSQFPRRAVLKNVQTIGKAYMWVKKQQLELCMEQLTGSGLRKEYKAVYCHPLHLTYTQSTSYEMLGWMSYRLESRLLGEIPTTSDMQMIQPNGRKRRGTKEPLDEGERGG